MCHIVKCIYCAVALFLYSCSASTNQSILIVNALFEKNDTLSVEIVCKKDKSYKNAIPLLGNDSVQSVVVSTPCSPQDILYVNLLMNQTNEQISIRLHSLELQGIATIQAKDLPQMLRIQEGCTCSLDSISSVYECSIQQLPATISFYASMFYQQRYDRWEIYLQVVFFVFASLLLFLHLRKEKGGRLTACMLLLFVAFLPLKWGGIALSFLGAGVLYALIWGKEKKFSTPPIFYLIAGLFLLRLVGLVFTIDLDWGISRLNQSVSFIIFPLIFSFTYIASRRNIEVTLLFFFRYMMLFAIFCLFSLFLYLPVLGIVSFTESILSAKEIYLYLLVFPSFWHPSFVSIIILMALPASIYLRFGNVRKRISTVEMLFCIAIIVLFVLLSGARIGLVVIPVLLGLSILFYVKTSWWSKVAVTTLGILAGLIVYTKSPSIQQKLDDPIRDQLNATAIEAFKEKSIFGWGTGSMEKLIRSQALTYELGYDYPQDRNHFHNTYLDELVQFGIVGSTVLFSLLALCIYLAIKKKDFLLLAFLAIYLPFMWVESTFCTSKGIIPMMFWLCFIIATQRVRLGKDKE